MIYHTKKDETEVLSIGGLAIELHVSHSPKRVGGRAIKHWEALHVALSHVNHGFTSDENSCFLPFSCVVCMELEDPVPIWIYHPSLFLFKCSKPQSLIAILILLLLFFFSLPCHVGDTSSDICRNSNKKQPSQLEKIVNLSISIQRIPVRLLPMITHALNK